MKFEQAKVALAVVSDQLVGRFGVDMDKFTSPVESGHPHSHAVMNRCALCSDVIARLLVNQDGFREAGAYDPLNVDVAAGAWTEERQVADDQVQARLLDAKLPGSFEVLYTVTNER